VKKEVTPVVAFVVPTYNGELTIARTLETILAQDYPAGAMEVVVVDNNSTDGTSGVVRRFPVKLIAEPKRGRSAPRNRGVATASPKAEFIASVDADCVLSKNFLSKLMGAIDRPWIAAAQAAIEVVGSGNRLDRPERQAHYYMPYLATGGMVVRRAAFDTTGGFDEELERCVDMDFSFRLLACGYAFAWVGEKLVSTTRESREGHAFSLGWESGKSSFQLNAKWRHRLNRTTMGLAFDKLKSWTLPLARQIVALKPTAPVLAAETAGRIVSHAYHRALGAPTTRTSFSPATRLPEILGPERYLLLEGERCAIYDAPARRILRLDENDTAILKTLIDGDAPVGGDALRKRLRLG
jgi:GT2 family glycosyltransferase